MEFRLAGRERYAAQPPVIRVSLVASGMSHVRESRMLCRRLVDLFTLLSHTQETGARRMGMTQELLALVTGIAHYLKILIRIALTGALRLGQKHGLSEALGSFLDKLHMLALQKGSSSARRMVAEAKDVVPLTQRSAAINTSTYGVAYGFRSLAPEIAGASPFLDASQDIAISDVPVPSPPSDTCVVCSLTVEEDCVRLGTYQRWHSSCIRCKTCGIDASPAATVNVEHKALESGRGTGVGIVVPVVSTARRPPANVDLFVWSPNSITNTLSFGEVPTMIYCTNHAHQGCRGGFQTVSRLEQYAFLLNVALRRLHNLLKKRKLIPLRPSSTCCVFPTTARAIHLPSASSADSSPISPGDSPGETSSTPRSQDLMRLKNFNLDQKLSATAQIPKRLNVVGSRLGEVAHSSKASLPKLNPLRSLPLQPIPTDIPRLGDAENAVEQRRALPGHLNVVESSGDREAHSRDASVSTDNTSKNVVPEPTPADSPRLGETEKLAKHRRPLPSVPTEDGIAFAEFLQFAEAAQAMEQHRSTPPQNMIPYVADLTPLELAIVRHAAVAVLYRSELRDELDLDQILEMLEVKRQRFWERLFKSGNDRKKKGAR